MRRSSLFCTVAAIGTLAVLVSLSGVAHAQTAPTDSGSGSTASAGSSGGTTVFPPTNLAAGSGLLYFPQGGNSSLYAVPVLDSGIAAAISQQTTTLSGITIGQNNATTAALTTLTNAVTAQTAVL